MISDDDNDDDDGPDFLRVAAAAAGADVGEAGETEGCDVAKPKRKTTVWERMSNAREAKARKTVHR